MIMTKSYEVADHVFSFRFPDGHPLPGKLGQYAPFGVSAAADPAFTVEIVGNVPEMPSEKVYGGGGEPGETVVNLYRGDGCWAFDIAPSAGHPVSGRAVCDSSFTRAGLQICNPALDLFALNNTAMLMYAFRTAAEGTLAVHASVIENGGRAFLWMAKSGTGKSTHSRLWLENVPGSSLLNDDNPVVRVKPDGGVEVSGTPWSGKTPCYRNAHFPAGAFVRIVRSPGNRMERMDALEAYALLYSSSSGFKGDRAMADGLHSTFEKIVGSVPCYSLFCRPDREAALVSSSELLKP